MSELEPPALPEPPAVPHAAAPRPVRLVLELQPLERSRLTVLLRGLLVLPHLVWLMLWTVVAAVVAFVAWLAVLIDAQVPRSIHGHLASYLRYATHVSSYASLVGARFPGFLGRPGYDVDLEVAPPARQSRWSGGFRLLLALPAVAVASTLGATGGSTYLSYGFPLSVGLASVAAFLAWFAVLVRGALPRGLRDATAFSLAYAAEANAYVLLLTGAYPCAAPAVVTPWLDLPAHPVSLRDDDAPHRSRLTVLFRLPLAAPHLVWLTLWSLAAVLAVLVAWLAALVTAHVPSPLHRFLAAYTRYRMHVTAFLTVVGGPFPGFVGRAGSYPVDLELPAAPARQRRWTLLLRTVLALPALLLASAYATILLVVAVLIWFASLATGRAPAGLQQLGAVSLRYAMQTTAYLLLLTERYPDAGPALRAVPRDVQLELPFDDGSVPA